MAAGVTRRIREPLPRGQILTPETMVRPAGVALTTLRLDASRLAEAATTRISTRETPLDIGAPQLTTRTPASWQAEERALQAIVTPARARPAMAVLFTTQIPTPALPLERTTFTPARTARYIATTATVAVGRRTLETDGKLPRDLEALQLNTRQSSASRKRGHRERSVLRTLIACVVRPAIVPRRGWAAAGEGRTARQFFAKLGKGAFFRWNFPSLHGCLLCCCFSAC